MSAVIELTLTAIGPIMTTGAEGARFGRDDTFLRDAEGQLVIPGTQVRGLLRHVLHSISQAAPDKLSASRIDQWFGTASAHRDDAAPGTGFQGPASGWKPNRGCLRFEDLRWSGNATGPGAGAITRIEVAEHTGSVEIGSLQILERSIGIGEPATFKGRVAIDAAADEAQCIADWFATALQLVPALGAHKSAGFGRLERAEVGKPVVAIAAAPALHTAQVAALVRAREVALTLDFGRQPFLVSAGRWLGNTYRGSTAIPGSVLKAVIAECIGADRESDPLHDILANAVIREARLASIGGIRAGERACTPPLSKYLVIETPTSTGEIKSPALFDAFDPGSDPGDWAEAGEVAFQLDWKRTPDEIEQKYGTLDEVELQVRTRTAIDDNGVAAESLLFSHAAVKPRQGQLWHGLIGPGALNEADFAALLAALPRHLHGIGKTRASATLALAASRRPAVQRCSGRVRFMLETDAVLHTPAEVFAHGDLADPGERLQRQYAAYFAAALHERGGATIEPASLKLNFFATQKRVGGYLAARYPPGNHGYCPWFVTCRGSAFEIDLPATHADAYATLLDRGLPPPAGFDAARKTWRGNPFVSENGFGEIRLLKVNGQLLEPS